MKRLLTVLFLSVLSVGVFAQDLYEQYIAKYSAAAVSEMYRSGVPASITLAQGLLESGMGRSSLASTSNNHFGIKCHGWTGAKVYYDDDAKGECFRKYKTVAESYQDHSDFLRYKDRYKFLFDLETTDYKGWCYGLKKAGYATDPNYATKLINIIEKYKLYEYDSAASSESSASSSRVETVADHRKTETQKPSSAQKNTSSRPSRPAKKTRAVPESPNRIESLKPADGFAFSLSRTVYERNGVACVMALEGETYASIASDYDLFVKEILKFNDVSSDRRLFSGELVFIRAKKNQAAKGLSKHICDTDGETVWGIAQRYGLKVSSICKMNGIQADASLVEGDEIKLRKK